MPILSDSDAYHITHVLRCKIGDVIILFDGQGGEYEAEIIALAPQKVQASIIRKVSTEKEPPIHIAVAQGFLKEKKMDRIVRQISELGASAWIPFKAKRSVAVPDAKRIASRKARWEKIATESAKQCRRNRIMSIAPFTSFSQLLDHSKNYDQRILFYESETVPLKAPALETETKPIEKIIILLGPEGGFDPQEVKDARENGFVSAGLGPRILKAETAAVVACTLIQYIFGDMGQ